MRVLVIGGGGREHALAWALRASPLVTRLWCAPGNAGIAEEAECVAIAADDIAGLVAFAVTNRIELAVVGPEAPLVLGVVDALEAAGIPAFGPDRQAAELEGSKAFMKHVAVRAGVATAAHATFTDLDAALAHVTSAPTPIVVKADGLAAGKGVVVATTRAEAADAVRAALAERRFGAAGAKLVIEAFLPGEEASFFALCDGHSALPLAAAQDHKRLADGDQGPNTGGMGAYSPTAIVTPAMAAQVVETMILPTLRAMAELGRPFKGVLFAGLMIAADGPRLLEYNARFGDPEAQTLLPRLASDLLPALLAAREGRLDRVTLDWRRAAALTVVIAAPGYPQAPVPGGELTGLDAAARVEGVKLFHAATRRDAAGRVVASGGRVLGVSALAPDLAEARERAYRAVDLIGYAGAQARRDIGWRALA
jgi:phosphoribosylamine--glycine ligase